MKINTQTIFSMVLEIIKNKKEFHQFTDQHNYEISRLDEKSYVDLQKMCSENSYELSCENIGWSDKKLSTKEYKLQRVISKEEARAIYKFLVHYDKPLPTDIQDGLRKVIDPYFEDLQVESYEEQLQKMKDAGWQTEFTDEETFKFIAKQNETIQMDEEESNIKLDEEVKEIDDEVLIAKSNFPIELSEYRALSFQFMSKSMKQRLQEKLEKRNWRIVFNPCEYQGGMASKTATLRIELI